MVLYSFPDVIPNFSENRFIIAVLSLNLSAEELIHDLINSIISNKGPYLKHVRGTTPTVWPEPILKKVSGW